MFDFKNKISSQGIHYSRYIVSWVKSGGKVKDIRVFLQTLGLPDEEIKEIYLLATNGKLELETRARMFLER